MYLKKTITIITGAFLMYACSSDTPKVRAVCDNENPNSYVIKWEVFPMNSGKVKIFESHNPDSFDNERLIEEKSIGDGFAIVQRVDDQRHFFHLVFDKKYSTIVGERHIITERIDNLRDLGGYHEGKSKQIKWGKIYRSGTLSWLSQKDRITLDSLHIQTVVDLRNSNKIKQYPSLYKAPANINLYLQDLSADSIRNKIIGGQMRKGDVLIALQDMYAQIIDKDTAQLRQLFDLFLDEGNYPVLYHCALGKDRSGLISVLLLEALGVDREEIFHDYMLSNHYINFNRAVVQAPDLPEDAQKALTTLLSANEPVFNFIYDKIKMDYGSIDNYLEKILQLTNKKREKLQKILLY